jgi:hypothetical protein
LWSAFKVDIEQYLQKLMAYANGPGPQRVKDTAAAITNTVAQYAVDRVAHWPGPRSPDGKTAFAATSMVPWLLGLPTDPSRVDGLPPTAWAWAPAPGRDAGLAAFRTQIDLDLQQSNASAPLRTEVERGLMAYAAAWMAYGVTKRRHADEVPWHGLAPLRQKAPEGIKTVGLTVDATGPIDFVASFEMPADLGRSREVIEAAVGALESVAQTADALDGLLMMWFNPTQSIQIPLRWSGLAAIAPVLTQLAGVGGIVPSIGTVILRMPMLRTETTGLSGAHPELPALLDAMTEEMLFGPSRRLLIQAFHGLAQPQEDHVERVDP